MTTEGDTVPDLSGDDPAIPGAETVYRRLSDSGPSMIAVDAITQDRRPTSGAFKPDGDGVSVYRETKLRAAGLAAVDLVREPQNVVVGLVVREVRSLHLGVRDDEWPSDVDDPRHPRNGAHAVIVGWQSLSTNERRERQRALSRLPSLQFVV